MSIIFTLLGLLCLVGGVICSIIILIGAFQDEVWKGFVCLLCGLYMLYYAIVDFDHEKKWTIVLGSLLGSVLGSVFMAIAQR